MGVAGGGVSVNTDEPPVVGVSVKKDGASEGKADEKIFVALLVGAEDGTLEKLFVTLLVGTTLGT